MWAAHPVPASPVRPCGSSGDVPPDPVALLRAAAVEIARMPGLAERLRAVHLPGPDGRCRGCASAVRTAPRWPCRISALVADGR